MKKVMSVSLLATALTLTMSTYANSHWAMGTSTRDGIVYTPSHVEAASQPVGLLGSWLYSLPVGTADSNSVVVERYTLQSDKKIKVAQLVSYLKEFQPAGESSANHMCGWEKKGSNKIQFHWLNKAGKAQSVIALIKGKQISFKEEELSRKESKALENEYSSLSSDQKAQCCPCCPVSLLSTYLAGLGNSVSVYYTWAGDKPGLKVMAADLKVLIGEAAKAAGISEKGMPMEIISSTDGELEVVYALGSSAAVSTEITVDSQQLAYRLTPLKPASRIYGEMVGYYGALSDTQWGLIYSTVWNR